LCLKVSRLRVLAALFEDTPKSVRDVVGETGLSAGSVEEMTTQPNGRVKRVKTELTPKGRQISQLVKKIEQALT